MSIHEVQLLHDFPSVLIWRCMVSFDAPSSSESLRIFFCEFSSNSAHILNIPNLGRPERDKSLVFSSPVLKRWNLCCATRSLTTPRSTLHIL